MPPRIAVHPAEVPLDYSTLRVKSTVASRVCGTCSLGVGILGTGVAFWLASTLNSVPPGSSIRPMGLAALIMLTVAGTLLTGLVLGGVCLAKSRRLGVLEHFSLRYSVISAVPDEVQSVLGCD